MPVKLAIFDIDGTLARTKAVDEACYEIALDRAFGLTDVSGTTADYVHSTDSGILQEIFADRFGRPRSWTIQ